MGTKVKRAILRRRNGDSTCTETDEQTLKGFANLRIPVFHEHGECREWNHPASRSDRYSFPAEIVCLRIRSGAHGRHLQNTGKFE
jgi:hypothetical protein